MGFFFMWLLVGASYGLVVTIAAVVALAVIDRAKRNLRPTREEGDE